MKHLYIQTYFTIGKSKTLMHEEKVTNFTNWQEYKSDKSKDVLAISFLNNPTFKLVFK